EASTQEISMRRIFAIGVIVGLLALGLQSVQSQSQPAKKVAPAGRSAKAKNKARPTADRSGDEAAIRANIAQLVKASNARDAQAVAALFTPDGQIVDKEGNESTGREAIAKTFGELFAATPKKRLEVFIESIRSIGADLAVEVGTTKETAAPTEPPEYDRYTV